MWLCSNKTLFIKISSEPDLAIFIGSPLFLLLGPSCPSQSLRKVSLPGHGLSSACCFVSSQGIPQLWSIDSVLGSLLGAGYPSYIIQLNPTITI